MRSDFEGPRTPVKGRQSGPARGRLAESPFPLEPYTPESSPEEHAESIFSPAESVQTTFTEDDGDYGWDTPTKKPSAVRGCSPCSESTQSSSLRAVRGRTLWPTVTPLRPQGREWPDPAFDVATANFDPVYDPDRLYPSVSKHKKSILRPGKALIRWAVPGADLSYEIEPNGVDDLSDIPKIGFARKIRSRPSLPHCHQMFIPRDRLIVRRHSISLSNKGFSRRDEQQRLPDRRRSGRCLNSPQPLLLESCGLVFISSTVKASRRQVSMGKSEQRTKLSPPTSENPKVQSHPTRQQVAPNCRNLQGKSKQTTHIDFTALYISSLRNLPHVKRRRVSEDKRVILDAGNSGQAFSFLLGGEYHRTPGHSPRSRSPPPEPVNDTSMCNNDCQLQQSSVQVEQSQTNHWEIVKDQWLANILDRFIRASLSENPTSCLALIIPKKDGRDRCSRHIRRDAPRILRYLDTLLLYGARTSSTYVKLLLHQSMLCTQHQTNAQKLSFWKRLLAAYPEVNNFLALLLQHVPGAEKCLPIGGYSKAPSVTTPRTSPSVPRSSASSTAVVSTKFEISPIQIFEPYLPVRLIGTSLNEALRAAITRPLTRREITDRGFIYMYWQPGNFGHVKIGLSNDIKRRMKSWEKDCKKKVYLHYPAENETADLVPHIHRVEALIQTELKDYRKKETRCPGCFKTHREWFELNSTVTKEVVLHIINKWVKWMRAEPYGPVFGADPATVQWVLTDSQAKRMGALSQPHAKLKPQMSAARSSKSLSGQQWSLHKEPMQLTDLVKFKVNQVIPVKE